MIYLMPLALVLPHLQADFANEYLGGGVLSGGGSQEESMFIECPEMLTTMFLVEKLLPFEAVEMSGAKRFIEHNMMGARYMNRHEQFCRPFAVADMTVTAVAFDAICFNAYGNLSKGEQYQPTHIKRELRKCLAALRSLEGDAVVTRSFVTGNWGCGAFRGDIELKCVIQWMACSLECSVNTLIYCPFDQHQQLVHAGLSELIDKIAGRVPVKKILDLLLDDSSYQKSPNTFRYLLEKLASGA